MLTGGGPDPAAHGAGLVCKQDTGTGPEIARAAAAPRFCAAEIKALFSPFEGARKILLAVSGGPDSVALMLLAADWARGGAAPPLSVATVDHGLRKESESEAQTVGRWASALFLPHAILAWDGVKPRTRVQERAREARYELLFEHAAKIGADHVMTAHHADDQAETVLFRLIRGSGVAGLSGMAASSRRGGLILARPLLRYAKADLEACCKEKAHPFLSDPSNNDPGYARTRLRRLGGLLSREGLDRSALLKLSRRAARADAALAARAQAVRASLQARREPGRFEADISLLAAEPDEIVLRFLADELKLIGGGKQLRLERLEDITEGLCKALRTRSAFAATLGGSALWLRSGRNLVISKEGARGPKTRIKRPSP
jgi:tRNA(Ile)-lysidine synthase